MSDTAPAAPTTTTSGIGDDSGVAADGGSNDGEGGAVAGLEATSTTIAVRAESALHTDKGTTTIAEGVVAKIVGIATREVAGIHSMGSGAGRAMGSVKDLLPGGSSSVTEGVSVEVGSTQAAADLSIVTEYGMAIQDVAQAVRDNVIRRVQQMTGLEMVEVNIAVTDVNVPTKSAGTPSVPGASSGRQQRVQ